MDVSACTSIPNTTETAISPLIRFALRGLKRCWLPQQGRWSFAYHLDGRPNPNESRPGYDVYYTLNVLLGLSRLAKTGYLPPLDLRAVFIENALAMVDLPVPRYAYGMALWASAELGQTLPNPALAAARRLIADGSGWRRWRAQDLGMMLSGTVSQARTDRKLWSDPAHRLFRFLRERFCSGSGLFFDQASGLRRRWASFATQTYLTLACYHYGELFGDRNAIGVANRCAAKLISLQGPDGEWPWFYDVPRGCIVDWYEVYSVHQDGMAPAFLEHAEPHGVRGATEALSRGFVWIYGNNQLGQSMLAPELGLIIRSQLRRGELATRGKRAMRAIVTSATGRTGSLVPRDRIELRLECRSYHLGWVIWSFAQRRDLLDITHHPALLA